MVSVLALYSEDSSSSPVEAYSFAVKFVFDKNKNKQKEAGDDQFLITNLGIPQQKLCKVDILTGADLKSILNLPLLITV